MAMTNDKKMKTNEKVDEKTLCINCKKPALNNCYSEDGRKEVAISGLCEKCFDEICNDDGDAEDLTYY